MNKTVHDAVMEHLDSRFDTLEAKLDKLEELFKEVHKLETTWQPIELPQFEVTKKLY